MTVNLACLVRPDVLSALAERPIWAWQRLVGSWPRWFPHRVMMAAFPPGPGRPWRVVTGAGSGGGERVVAELGQDVASLPDDLAGFGQGGAFGVLAVGDGGVVAVVGSRGAGVGFAGFIDRPAQHRGSLPG